MRAVQGAILHCLRDPGFPPDRDAIECIEDGLLLIDDGKIVEYGPVSSFSDRLPRHVERVDHGESLLIPGFIDCHVHYPQIDIIGSYGEQLLDWLKS